MFFLGPKDFLFYLKFSILLHHGVIWFSMSPTHTHIQCVLEFLSRKKLSKICFLLKLFLNSSEETTTTTTLPTQIGNKQKPILFLDQQQREKFFAKKTFGLVKIVAYRVCLLPFYSSNIFFFFFIYYVNVMSDECRKEIKMKKIFTVWFENIIKEVKPFFYDLFFLLNQNKREKKDS